MQCPAYQLEMDLQIQIGRSHAHGTPVSGMALDLQKRFNSLPRRPALHRMKLLKIQSNALQVWYNSLVRVTRVLRINDSLTQPIAATTGVPEGCPVAVLVMTVFAWAAAATLQANHVQPISYYDDWSWRTSEFRRNEAALNSMTSFCSSAKLTINFRKSWAWASAHVNDRA